MPSAVLSEDAVPRFVPGTWNATLALTRAQFRYRLVALVLLVLLQTALLGTMIFVGNDEVDQYLMVALVLNFLCGGGVCIFNWGVDAAERRVRLLAALPVPRATVAVARLLATALLQLVLTAAAWLVLLPRLGSSGRGIESALYLSSGAVWILALVFSTYFTEEINVALSGRRWLLYAANLVAVATILGFSAIAFPVLFGEDGGFDPWALLSGLGALLFFGGGSVVLFVARRTFEVGVSPWHGFPVDWSEEER